MTINTPFSQNRFEYEGRHSYFLPTDIFARLQTAKPKYLVGSRGSGKTTLCKALCWEEQISNESLKCQLETTFLERQYIGTYVKLPNIQLRLLDKWLHASSDDVYDAVFSFYLELIHVHLVAESLGQTAARSLLNISVDMERSAVPRWIHDCQFIHAQGITSQIDSLPAFVDRVAATRREIERSAFRNDSPITIVERFNINQITTTTATLMRNMATMCDVATSSPDGTWHFKVCMDEGECLNDRQQRVVRTAIRLAQWPLFPILSFVRLPDDRSTTGLTRLTLQAADLEQIVLDDMAKSEFKLLAEGVATIRCRQHLAIDNAKVALDPLLGAADINHILKDILTASESATATGLLALAEALKMRLSNAAGLNDDDNVRDGKGINSLPIWQAYLIDRLKLDYPYEADRKEQRHYESIRLRKQMVSAYLSICRELQTAPKYASADMVLEISDNCIRDFLAQMDEVFKAANKPVGDFIIGTVPHELQYDALLIASKAKKDSLPGSGVQSPVQARRIIEGLAFVTAWLQSSMPGDKHLAVPEQGRFAVELSPRQLIQHKELIDLVFDAADAGFLRVVSGQLSEPRFRVHTSLAPAFGFSYRGAYYDNWISIEGLERLTREGTDEGVRSAAHAIFSRLAREAPRPLLEGTT